ncbi:transposase [Streptomyces sp. NBC_01017]|uniref:IS1634 family transposase n=1 Tax=Streptomyces sp. NBC_01017 TaxID=2903721 RepID=UPI0038695297|nr:transposase [Streptomyces sp. NBC_01017]
MTTHHVGIGGRLDTLPTSGRLRHPPALLTAPAGALYTSALVIIQFDLNSRRAYDRTTRRGQTPRPGRTRARPPARHRPWALPSFSKVTAETRLDGKYLLATSDPDLSAEDVALGYKNLLEAERAFRTMKSTLDLRPVCHRLDERIRAHVLLRWLALLLIRVAERRTERTWPKIAAELGRIHQVSLSGPAGSLQQTTRLTDAQAKIFKGCGVSPPPKMSGLKTLD